LVGLLVRCLFACLARSIVHEATLGIWLLLCQWGSLFVCLFVCLLLYLSSLKQTSSKHLKSWHAIISTQRRALDGLAKLGQPSRRSASTRTLLTQPHILRVCCNPFWHTY
jgi:hypothetical protein